MEKTWRMLKEILEIHPQRIQMLIDDIESYKIAGFETEFDRTEREIVLQCLKLAQGLQRCGRIEIYK